MKRTTDKPAKKPGRKRKAAATIKAMENRSAALAHRREGLSYAQIGVEMGVSTAAAWKYVRQALEDLAEATQETAADLRTIEAERLDELQRAFWPWATERRTNRLTGEPLPPDEKAADRVLRIMAQRAQLFGLNEPERVEISLQGEAENAKAKIADRLSKRTPKK